MSTVNFQTCYKEFSSGNPRCVCLYIDNILVTDCIEEGYLNNLAEVLRRLGGAGMTLKKEKCAFLLTSVEYFGHIISAEGLCMSDSKFRAILDAPFPHYVRELFSFLGLVNYYSKFLPDIAMTLSPLYNLLQKKKK